MSENKLTKNYLEKLYSKYNRIDFVEDPIQIVLRSKEREDQEILAFISSLYAFGNIKQINSVLNRIFQLLQPSAKNRILDGDYLDYLRKKENINHRFLFHNQFVTLLFTLNLILNEFQDLKTLFLSGYNSEDKNLKSAITCFSKKLREYYRSSESIIIKEKSNLKIRDKIKRSNESRKLKFLFPDPFSNSTCKRMNLFLRWMVRKDNIDLGLWSEIKTSQLVIPLDTHIYHVANFYNLTQKKSPTWNMAVEITEQLKKFDPLDPVKYDFALSHLKL